MPLIVTSSATYADLWCDQGADWSATMTFTNSDGSTINVAGYTFNSAFRRTYSSWNVSGYITITAIDAPNGVVLLMMNANTTTATAPGKYCYDMNQEDTSGTTKRILYGNLYINPGITAN